MHCFQICGFTKSGKTTLATGVIRGLNSEGIKVASIKDICKEDFQIDTEGKNTYLHARAGANPVIARGLHETDFLYQEQLNLPEIVSRISADWLVVEGYSSFVLPKIVCAKNIDELEHFYDDRTFAIAGVIANEVKEYQGQKIYNPLDLQDMDELFLKIKSTVFPLLPYVDDDCCGRCGLTCHKMVEAIIQGKKERNDCVLDDAQVILKVNGKEIKMVGFVQNILRNTVIGVASELKGWQKGKKIELVISE